MSKVFIVAGEMSGDIHATELMTALKRVRPEVEFYGMGGDRMAAQSGAVENWTDRSAVMGVVEVAKHYSYFKEKFNEALDRIEELQPDLLVFVDYPGFNLRLCQAVHDRWPQIKKAYYISPKIWAWNKSRIPKMAGMLDLMLCLFPFEEKLLHDGGVPTKWVGHPLVDELEAERVEGDREKGLIGLFPGSREREVASLFPVMIESARQLNEQFPELKLKFKTAAASEKLSVFIKQLLNDAGVPDLVEVQEGGSLELMQRAEAGIVASGTATLEATYYHLPYCLIYKVAPLTYGLAKVLVKIKDIGLANILAGQRVVPEFVQSEATPAHIVPFIESILTNPLHKEELVGKLKQTATLLGKGGVHQNAAQELLKLLSA